jgi:hypothetical protein
VSGVFGESCCLLKNVESSEGGNILEVVSYLSWATALVLSTMTVWGSGINLILFSDKAEVISRVYSIWSDSSFVDVYTSPNSLLSNVDTFIIVCVH